MAAWSGLRLPGVAAFGHGWSRRQTLTALGLLATLLVPNLKARAATTLLNASYDPTRELYQDFNAAFARHWQVEAHEDVSVRMSHGGSGKQARAVIDGLPADIVTLALAYDIDAIAAQAKLLAADWQKRLPHNSCPYSSVILFLVRKGNPKGIKDWDDLAKKGVSVITPNPKTSGGARWNYLAAWGYGERKLGGAAEARRFVEALFRNVPVLDTGARGATTTFAERGMGDVLIAWENEAFLVLDRFKEAGFELVAPSVTILAEPPVAVVDKVAAAHGTAKVAEAYLQHLYSAEGQRIVAAHYYRPAMPDLVAAEALKRFPAIPTFTVESDFGGWAKAHAAHFADGGSFDLIYQPGQ